MFTIMEHFETHHLINLYYSHTQAAKILGIRRNTYTRACSLKQPAYHRYMRVLTQHLIREILSDIEDHKAEDGTINRNHRKLQPFIEALRICSGRSFKLNMGIGARPD